MSHTPPAKSQTLIWCMNKGTAQGLVQTARVVEYLIVGCRPSLRS